MIFTGDIAQPFRGATTLAFPDEMQTKAWLGNLEGSLIDVRGKKEDVRGVYNDYNAIAELVKHIPFKAFNLANNHLLDAADVKTTLVNVERFLRPVGSKRAEVERAVSVVGAGRDLEEARKPLVITDNDGSKHCILSFGWENIQCVPATKNSQGVNPYTRSHVLRCAKDAISEERLAVKGERLARVICFFHWDYELEKYPQPYDRQLAMDLIDIGVAAVIGCHAHRTQPIEFYKGKPIVYGLGNFLFCQGHYFGGKLCFPKFCEEEYAFEITKEGYKLHYFHYDQQANKLEYAQSAEIGEDKEFDGKAEFTGMSAKEYEKWFKAHRVQKKLLPIFKAKEPAVSYWMKSKWIQLRGWILDTAMKLNIKSAKRAER